MKTIFKKSCLLLTGVLLVASCKKFDEINNDPLKANGDQVQTEYFINNAIVGAQQDPGLSERVFILYWVVGGHTLQDEDGETFSRGSYDDGWTSEYYRQSSQWLNAANSAIEVGTDQIKKGTSKAYTNNLIQVARIWRAYLMSEFSDSFGPMPIDGFQGKNPDFKDVKTVYYYLLDELKDASSKLDLSVVNPSDLAKEDPAYGYNYAKWRKYANSMRMRLAMRLSEVDPEKAKSEFEAAAAGSDFITDVATETFSVQETPNSYNPLSSVFRKESSWMGLPISATYNNLSVGLGSVKSADQLGADFQSAIKPADWLGQKFPEQFATKTNDPAAGYWFNGLPYTIDPRAYKIFSIPGDLTNPVYPGIGDTFKAAERDLKKPGGGVAKTLTSKYTWNAKADGNWGAKSALNQAITTNGFKPLLNLNYRNGNNRRVFFGPWETYFLLAEASVRGWATPVSGKTAYETGIAKSFEYFGTTASLSTYLASTEYNRVGTSVNWDHTTEPGATHTMKYEDGITGTAGTQEVAYPKNDLYKAGTVRNDLLTKIITQKFIAQTPWLPLETWNDHRRLGLPFYETPAVEDVMPDLPALNNTNYNTSNIKFFAQRMKYPSNLSNSNVNGYNQAVAALGGPDAVLTPLWWAKH
ncbi:SusD/RagB family nutrient-binding outer membrane lipoprotein [Mucilaginibacter sp. 14171R-50]|uniref:SusD/RagB family nutrient-binding outer membrane lipoprotein n=1 Tax=Mucilaginibacter sp. 14171R-50 TaxID=2703789 RepID=UPI00138D7445|nr:SusD/RagB family nutrient-binding outer membrane lipoprotein [Mucilaginibacter sp. 14171R-50]QHS56325.1 SusD/RagB family nutrient-binding outer membrane lipoprotein [Mucilaginibacter sp. 14171R-50]